MTEKPGGRPDSGISLPQDPIPAATLRSALALAVARHEVPDEVISKVAERLSSIKLRIRGLDVCTHGICIDYFASDVGWMEKLTDLLRLERSYVYEINVLTHGTPVPDIYHIRVEQQFEELAPYTAGIGH
jgi:hypothetical protein